MVVNINLERGKISKSRIRSIEAQYHRHLEQCDSNPLYELSTRVVNCIKNKFNVNSYDCITGKNDYSKYPRKSDIKKLTIEEILEMPQLGKLGFLEIMEWIIK